MLVDDLSVDQRSLHVCYARVFRTRKDRDDSRDKTRIGSAWSSDFRSYGLLPDCFPDLYSRCWSDLPVVREIVLRALSF